MACDSRNSRHTLDFRWRRGLAAVGWCRPNQNGIPVQELILRMLRVRGGSGFRLSCSRFESRDLRSEQYLLGLLAKCGHQGASHALT